MANILKGSDNINNDKYHNRYTDEDLIKALMDFYIINDKIPNSSDFKKSHPNTSVFYNRFGSWTKALNKAGLFKEKQKSTDYTDQELIDLLIKFHRETKKVPTTRNINEVNYMPNNNTYIKRFNGFGNALNLAGLRNLRKDNHQFGRIEYSKESLLEMLQNFINELGRLPTAKEVDSNPNIPTCNPYNKHFGGLFGAYVELGYDLNKLKNNQKENFEHEMINRFLELTKIIGKTPNSRDLDKYSKLGLCCASKTYTEHFGSMRKLYKLIGLNNIIPDRKLSKKESLKPGLYKTKDDMVDDLKKLAKDLDRTPFLREFILYDNLASASSYCNKFGSWHNALKQAELQPNTKIFITKNGTKCYSSYEYKIACILEGLKIPFKKDTPYKKIIHTYYGFKRFDFIININNNIIFIEIFGMVNMENYEQGKREKLQLCKDNNIPLICFYPNDFWKYNNNEKIINYLYSLINNLNVDNNEELFSFLFTDIK